MSKQQPKVTFTIQTYQEFPTTDPKRPGETDVFVILQLGEREFKPLPIVPKKEFSEQWVKDQVQAYLEEKKKWEGKTFSI